jgi:hypothetical protein
MLVVAGSAAATGVALLLAAVVARAATASHAPFSATVVVVAVVGVLTVLAGVAGVPVANRLAATLLSPPGAASRERARR